MNVGGLTRAAAATASASPLTGFRGEMSANVLSGAEASDSARTMFPWKRASPSTKKKKVSHDVKIKSVNSDGTEVR